MNKHVEAFYEDLGEDYEEVRRDFLSHYSYGTLDDSIEDPLAYAVEFLQDNWEFENEVTEDAVRPWLEDEQTVALALVKAKHELRREDVMQVFRDKREAGGTFMQAARAASEDPSTLAHYLMTAKGYEIDTERLKVLRQARAEEYKDKAFRARQKAYRMISSKVEKAMKKADFSNLPPDKLADIMLKLAQLTKEDEPPEMTIRLDWNREV